MTQADVAAAAAASADAAADATVLHADAAAAAAQGGQFREVEREPFPQRFSGRAQANGQPHALKAQLRGKQGCKREPAEVEHEARN
eukprot:CAMPEP_0171624874 /NCGR_PEP_ID=MMETSP0990-20121206/18919_1 /TAXON_ID=483369 /ORGANISM="non described non described, Strain CCMP2098" /LENGTH=85 /DNA_ID=CAMNT_0012191587 /DNA_START=345 /DNA_END=603 /DNA_ORIENTATION=+